MFEDFETVNITPTEFELLVKNWLEMSAGNSIKDLKVTHLAMLKGSSGDYEIDVLAEFEVFGGANMKIIIECKKYASA
ncbi:hypothetical protein CXF74_21550 [Psychromonas sp. Urea-02u-13]|nr:hypothetical protein CXF74_21550 [Psychromonas sp. Urea-02u-13]